MASNGLEKRAKTGTCRNCNRRRCTIKHVQPVGTVTHGFATGYIWQCIDVENCKQWITNHQNKIKNNE